MGISSPQDRSRKCSLVPGALLPELFGSGVETPRPVARHLMGWMASVRKTWTSNKIMTSLVASSYTDLKLPNQSTWLKTNWWNCRNSILSTGTTDPWPGLSTLEVDLEMIDWTGLAKCYSAKNKGATSPATIPLQMHGVSIDHKEIV